MTTDNIYKFIVVEDHPLTRDGIVNYVKAHERFEHIGEFGDTRSVLNSTFSGRPDLIILDLNLPGIDGERSCAILKQKFPTCKIVACTNYPRTIKELKALGFDGYISKTEKEFFIDVLLKVLKGEKFYLLNEKKQFADHSKFEELDKFLKVKELTSREIEVAKLLMQDFSNREIGENLIISESTVETHRKHIKQKLGAKNKRELREILKVYEI
ncbi:MAG: response regulator transcription factor [Ferruginibacter sp.]